jgi:hypothetical protein
MDGYYKSNLDIILNEAIPNNWDGLAIVFGGEGAGKTTIVSQSCLYLDNNYNLKNVAITTNQFEKIIDTCKDGTSVHWDEAISGADASLHASKMQQSLISKLTQIRKKKLKIFFCFPYLWMLRRYFIERSLFGIYTYAKDFDDRGYAKFYSQPLLMNLHYQMKEKWKHNPNWAIQKCNYNFRFKFSNLLCLNAVEYDKKKDEGRLQVQDDNPRNLMYHERFSKLCFFCKTKGISLREIARHFNINQSSLLQVISRFKEDSNNMKNERTI